jgi:hypothetical protein
LGDTIADILNFFFADGPSFNGTLQPRASTNDPGSFGESLGIPTGLSIPNPGIVGALGLPTGDDCEFGGGDTGNALDNACYAHDSCYDNAGVIVKCPH